MGPKTRSRAPRPRARGQGGGDDRARGGDPDPLGDVRTYVARWAALGSRTAGQRVRPADESLRAVGRGPGARTRRAHRALAGSATRARSPASGDASLSVPTSMGGQWSAWRIEPTGPPSHT